MGFTRPSDIAIMVGIVMLVLLTVSVGVDHANTVGGNQSSAIFTSASGELAAYKNTSDGTSGALTSASGSSESTSEDSIATASFNAVLGLGRMVSTAINLLETVSESLNLPSYFLTIIIGMLLVVFAVVTYSWFRGSIIP